MNLIQPILSIIVISHEQREKLKRCLDSILAMDIPYPYEIIVSDDRSTDGSFELAKEYESACFDFQFGFHCQRILALQCDSDDGNCANNSQRSGYNRCNAYSHSQGKYIAHVDADDYFRSGAMVYEKQIEALDNHPECSLAMSNCICVLDGNPMESGIPWPFPRKMVDGEVIEQSDFVRGNWFRLNQCFIQRRNPHVDPVALYGNRYVDSVITYHHLQFGKVVYVEACDYVYVKGTTSVTGEMAKANKDGFISWCLGLYIPAIIPMWTRDFYMGYYYQHIREVIHLAQSGYCMQEKYFKALEGMHVWIFDCFGRRLNVCDRLRLRMADNWMKMMKKLGCESQFFVNTLNILLTRSI